MDPRSGQPASSDSEVGGNEGEAPSLHEPVQADVAAITVPRAPITAGATAGIGGSRARWLIGGGIAVAAVAALAIGAALVGARPFPEALKYVPADSAVAAVLHPELPGDQRQRLGNLLAHFPGFADQSILDQKIDEVLGRLTREETGGAVDYEKQVKPLLAGPLALAISRSAINGAMTGGTPEGFLVIATTDGAATCDSVFGSSVAGRAYRENEIRIVEFATACALHGRFMLLGDIDSVRAGLDARLDSRGIDGSAAYRAADGTLEGDQLATLYVGGEAVQAVLEGASALGQTLPKIDLAPWMIAGLSAEDGALVVDTYVGPVAAAAVPSGAPSLAPAAQSRFAAALPADALGYLEVHGVGALLERALASMRADPAQAEAVAQLESALAAGGGAGNLISWIEDAGVAILPARDSVGGALLVRGTDGDAAAARVTQIRNLLVLAATGTDMTVRDSEHAGVKITSVDLGDLSTLLAGLGMPVEAGNLRLSFSIAARDDLVMVGVGDGILERIIDANAASSLKTSGSYGPAMVLAGSTNDMQLYVALDSLIAFVEGLAPADQLDAWNRDLKPYADHLAAVGWASSRGSAAVTHMRLLLTVK